MKSPQWMARGAALTALVLSSAAFSQTAMKLSPEDVQAIQSLASRYFSVLGSCDAEGFADLFVDKTGYFASGFRGHMVGRERLLALVKSERHCDVPAGAPPAARANDSKRPEVVLTATATGASGLTDLGAAQYEDEYVHTPQGWRIAGRTVITSAEKAAGIDAKELSAIHRLLGPSLADYYVTNDKGIKQLMTTGVALRIVEGTVTGHSYVQGGGYNDDVFEKLGAQQWRIKSRTFVAAGAAVTK